MKAFRTLVILVALSICLHSQHEQHQTTPAPPPKQPAEPAQKSDARATQQQPQKPPTTESHEQHAQPATPAVAQPAMPSQGQRSIEELIRTSPSNLLPRMGERDSSVATISLAQLEESAVRSNPTVRQAEAQLRAAKGRRTQAGLWPNPTVGYSGEEIRGGQLGGGQHGAFVEQTVLLGGKLSSARRVADQEVRLAEIEVEEQRLRVQNAVRIGYFQVLASQEMLRLDNAMITLAASTLATAQRLRNIGQNDGSEVLQSEIELKRAEVAARVQEARLRREWRSLAALIGEPQLSFRRVEGRLDEDTGRIDPDAIIATIVSSSPATRLADVAVERAQAELTNARKFAIPDLTLRGGLQQNFEQAEGTNRAIGMQGFAEVGINLPIFNRNQGNVEAARADVERARLEQQRVRLALHQRAADAAFGYSSALQVAQNYQREILPRAEKLFAMQLTAWGQMRTSYPQVLSAQRGLFDAQTEYIEALEQLRTTTLTLQGFLLTDGLEAPASPDEVSMPVREINLPRGERR